MTWIERDVDHVSGAPQRRARQASDECRVLALDGSEQLGPGVFAHFYNSAEARRIIRALSGEVKVMWPDSDKDVVAAGG